ncbi:MAG TPA: histidine kinase [Polyangiales bacterium]|nr:histidine kinase [Polyangiales bacterium]
MKDARLRMMTFGWSVASAASLTVVYAVLGPPNLPSLIRMFAASGIYAVVIGIPAALVSPPLIRVGRGMRLSFRIALGTFSSLFVSVPCALLGTSILVVVGLVPAAERWSRWEQDVRVTVLVSLAVGVATVTYRCLHERLEKTQLELKGQELARARAEQLASEAQFASLASRLQPHFLFNTLNSISSLIRTDPVQAERILGRLASLLRASLDCRASELVPLGRELKLVADYLEIQHVRHPQRLRYQLQVAPTLLDQRVPPFSIQTLVENAVKYAVAPSVIGSMIRVVAGVRDGRLCVEVWDEGPGFSADEIPPNHGLDNLQARLRSIYADTARLIISREPLGAPGLEQTRVAVELPVPSEVAV